MLLFKKKKKEDESTDEDADDTAEDDSKTDVSKIQEEVAKTETPMPTGTDASSVIRLSTTLEKLKIQFSTFLEIQKSTNERFSSMNEQIGGIRSMMMDRDKNFQKLEAKSMQAIDMVESVQPDKLMMDLKKLENKIEMIKSPISTNESMISNAMAELKEMRRKVNSFKGVEEAIKLADEVKKDWMENKKLDANITKHSAKIETIYSEMWKEFSEFKKFSSRVTDLDQTLKTISTEIDSIKVKVTSFANKKDVENMVVKLESFEKYVNNVISTMNNKITNFSKDFSNEFTQKMQKTTKLLTGFETLATKTPDLDKYFNLLSDEAKKSADKKEVKPEKIKTPGEDEKIDAKPKDNIINKIKDKISK
jgi:predicted  nucleic acid-binding Zn-ribbon protein